MSQGLCIIIGVGPGMGLALARKFSQNGFDIAQLARRQEALESYQSDLEDTGSKVSSYPVDVSDLDKLGQVMDTIYTEQGEAEVLIYNVSVLNPSPPSTLGIQDLITEFKINVASALVCAQKVIPYMEKRKRGKILLTGGGLALKPYYEFTSLGIGKAAMRSLSISLGQELIPKGIHVATVTINGMIEPGTHFDPDKISEEFWKLYKQPPGKQEIEIIYK